MARRATSRVERLDRVISTIASLVCCVPETRNNRCSSHGTQKKWFVKHTPRATPELADASAAEIVRDFADESRPPEGVIIWSNASREQRRVWSGQLPTPPRALPALRQQTRLDPAQHDPTLKLGEPSKQHTGRARCRRRHCAHGRTTRPIRATPGDGVNRDSCARRVHLDLRWVHPHDRQLQLRVIESAGHSHDDSLSSLSSPVSRFSSKCFWQSSA